jgi:SPP1 gp7 family putative phage head morphogenesis protein
VSGFFLCIGDILGLIQTYKDFKAILQNYQQTRTKGDTSDYESPFYFPSQNAFFNPDDIAQKFRLDKYDEMKLDDQVKATLYLKKMTVIGTGGNVTSPDIEDISDEEIKITSFVDFVFNDFLKGSFTKFLYKDMSAFDYGFSVTEKIQKVIEHGEFKGLIGINQLKTRPPHTFDQGFITDQHGNLIKIIQDGKDGKIELNPKKFIIYTYNSDFDGNFYGTSDLRAAYNPWFRKQNGNKFWAIGLERASISPAIAFVERGIGTTEKQTVFDWLKNLQMKMAAVFHKGTDIQFPEVKSEGLKKAFLEYSNYQDRSIARAMLVPDQAGFSDNKFGSRALGESQIKNIFFNVINFLREEQEEEIIFEQIIKPLVDINFGKQVNYPRYKFNPLTEEDKQKILELVISAVEKGVIIKDEAIENVVREQLNVPPREETEEPIEQPVEKKPEPDKEQKDIADEIEESEKINFVEIKLHRKPNKHEEKMEFTEVADELQDAENKTLNKAQKVMADITEKLINGVVNKKVIENQDMAAINKLDIPGFGKLRQVFHDSSLGVNSLGKKRGKTAISNAAQQFQSAFNFDLTPKQAIDWLKKNSIAITGVVKHDVEDKAKRILYNALRTGKTTKETIFELEQMMQPYIEGQVVARAVTEPWRLENIVRTNTNTAYNMGLKEEYESTTFVTRYEVSAILDSRTSDICNELDGEVFAKDNPAFTFPPYHFQCRTIVVPIVEGEDSTLSTKNPQQPTAKTNVQTGFGIESKR